MASEEASEIKQPWRGAGDLPLSWRSLGSQGKRLSRSHLSAAFPGQRCTVRREEELPRQQFEQPWREMRLQQAGRRWQNGEDGRWCERGRGSKTQQSRRLTGGRAKEARAQRPWGSLPQLSPEPCDASESWGAESRDFWSAGLGHDRPAGCPREPAGSCTLKPHSQLPDPYQGAEAETVQEMPTSHETVGPTSRQGFWNRDRLAFSVKGRRVHVSGFQATWSLLDPGRHVAGTRANEGQGCVLSKGSRT